MIEARNITKSFTAGQEKTIVLKNISFTVAEGEFVSLMGASGSGKSTLLYILGGLDRADSGGVILDGQEIGNLSDARESAIRRRQIGFVFQAYNLIENLSVEENVLVPALMDGHRRKEMEERLKEMLQAVGLWEHRRKRPMELSGGQQQRTAIARALMNRPRIVFADEPIGNLDSRNGNEILALLRKLNQQYQVTILMVTHSEESTKYGSRVIRLKDGAII